MSNPENPINPTVELWSSVSKLFFTILAAWFLSNFIAVAVALPMFDFSLPAMQTFLENPLIYPQYRMAMMQIQGIISVCTFVAAPMFYLKYLDNEAFSVKINQHENQEINPLLWILTPLIVIGFMPIDVWIVEWNQAVVLPEIFKNIEIWAQAQEKLGQELTKYLTSFDNIVEFLAAIVTLAIVPAIGEELLFRGLLQNKIELLAKNKHIAIWIAAFIFSFIHFQFYGFVPRLLLGALFGYLYMWSGNLTIPILAHFVNNGFTLLLLYSGINLEGTMPIEITVLCLVLVISFLFIFKKIITVDKTIPN